jgi:hypothetical protein
VAERLSRLSLQELCRQHSVRMPHTVLTAMARHSFCLIEQLLAKRGSEFSDLPRKLPVIHSTFNPHFKRNIPFRNWNILFHVSKEENGLNPNNFGSNSSQYLPMPILSPRPRGVIEML